MTSGSGGDGSDVSDGGYRVGLQGLDDEVDVDLEVDGELPAWLVGTLVRNGPGRWTARPGDHPEGPGQRVRHWFDGLAQLHRFTLGGGRVRYADRYLRSPAHDAAVERGEVAYTEFGTVPRRTPWQRVRELRAPRFGDNASVNVVRVGERLLALTESPGAVPFDPVTLATGAPLRYADDVPGVVTTAHPLHDARSGALLNHSVELGRTSAYHVHEVVDAGAGGLVRRPLARVAVDRPSYMHTFAATERFVVLVEYPCVIDPLALLLGRPPLDAFSWRPRRGTRFTVVERATGAVVARPVTDAFFCWHQVGAVDDGDALHLDQLVTPGERAARQFLLDDLLGSGVRSPSGELRRFRVPLDGGPVTQHLLSTTPFEFPRTLPAPLGTPVRRVWGVGTADALTTGYGDRLVAVDAETGTTRTWSAPGCWPGEPVPVAAPGAEHGDGDGEAVVLSLVLDARARRSFLLVLDAATLTERARAPLPHAVPHGFHGDFFPGVGVDVGAR